MPEEVPGAWGQHEPCHWWRAVNLRGRDAGEGRTDGLRDQLRHDVLLVVLGDGGDDGRKRRDVGELMLPRQLGAQAVQVDVSPGVLGVLGGLVILYEDICDVGATSQEALVFRRQVGLLLSARGDGRGGDRGGSHIGCCFRNCSRAINGGTDNILTLLLNPKVARSRVEDMESLFHVSFQRCRNVRPRWWGSSRTRYLVDTYMV